MEQLGIVFLVILGIACCLAVMGICILTIIELLNLAKMLVESIKELF